MNLFPSLTVLLFPLSLLLLHLVVLLSRTSLFIVYFEKRKNIEITYHDVFL